MQFFEKVAKRKKRKHFFTQCFNVSYMISILRPCMTSLSHLFVKIDPLSFGLCLFYPSICFGALFKKKQDSR